jgi:hypothetical protein
MSRSVAHRAHSVQTEKLSPSIDPVRPTEAANPVARPGSGLPWFWQIVMFLWITSFLGLLAYEWLWGLIKAW